MTLQLNLQKGLVGHWTMASIDNEAIRDSSANDFHLSDGTPSTTTGFIEQSIIAEGQSYSYGNAKFMNAIGNAEFSICFWVKQTSNQDNFQDFIVWNDGTSKQSAKRIERGFSEGSTEQDYWTNLGMNPNTSKGNLNNRSIGIEINNWWHLAVTVSGSDNTFRVYVNGNIDRSSAVETSEIESPGELSIDASGAYNANIEDLRFYDRSLSKEEVSSIYNARSQRNASI